MAENGTPHGMITRRRLLAMASAAGVALSRPALETPFEVFDKGVFTPNDQFYVRWH
jgi:hypothetical protein